MILSPLVLRDLRVDASLARNISQGGKCLTVTGGLAYMSTALIASVKGFVTLALFTPTDISSKN